jgi:hypothetical protein
VGPAISVRQLGGGSREEVHERDDDEYGDDVVNVVAAIRGHGKKKWKKMWRKVTCGMARGRCIPSLV